jgi:hypothetical protein
LLALAVVACLLGVYADQGSRLPVPWSFIAEFGTPWVVLPFLAGRRSSKVWAGAALGASMLTLGLLSYYCWMLFVEEVALDTVIRHYGSPAWTALGAGVGAAFGLLGLASRARTPALLPTASWSVVAAVPVAEAWRAMEWTYVAHHLMLVAAMLTIAAITIIWAVRTSAGRPLTLTLGTLLVAVIFVPAQFIMFEVVR